MSVKVTKNEIKKNLREELRCDYGFIVRLTKSGMIQRLQDSCADDDSNVLVQEIMKEIYEEYRNYCKAFDLDCEADNRNNKKYLQRK